MKIDYQDKALTVYDEWIKKVKIIICHKYDMKLDDYLPKYNFKRAYNDGLSPREAAERLAKVELDLP
jgi:hypothetical protein